MDKIKKTFMLMVTFLVGFSILGLRYEAAAEDKPMIGLSMPSQSLQRWNQDGENLKKFFEDKGYEVDLQFAENKVDVQASQIENMMIKGAEVLVVAAIDGQALSGVLDDAERDGIDVVAYDRLIMNTDAVDYYATFDNEKVGEIQGQFIVDQLDLDNQDGPFNLELVTGAPDDNNVVFFFGGAMKVLQPYIDEGKLVIQSGQDTREQAATPNWSEQESQARMENILTAYYQKEDLDAVLCSNDSVAIGVITALKDAGYSDNMPIVTGMDADVANVKAIVSGDQSMSVFKDTRQLAEKVVEMVEALIEGKEVEVNDTESYDNGNKVVPSYLLEPQFVDKDNYKELLIDTGYYTEDEVN